MATVAPDIGLGHLRKLLSVSNGRQNPQKGARLAWAVDRDNLSIGSHTLHLDFDGLSLKKHNVNGPYYLRNLTLARGNSDEGFELADIVIDTHTTSAYNYSDFGDKSPPLQESRGKSSSRRDLERDNNQLC